jgi:hypothetical protein
MTAGGKDADGNPIPPSEDWVNLTRCRDEAGNGKAITLSDGTQQQYSYLIQMPKGVEAIAFDKKVRVLDSANNVRAEGKVIYSRKDQLHSRIWL